jgi:hypothetical protein
MYSFVHTPHTPHMALVIHCQKEMKLFVGRISKMALIINFEKMAHTAERI